METNELKSFINSVMNENLVQAKNIVADELNKRLGAALEDKFETYAATIFEKWDAEKADKNKDGKVSDWEKASTQWAGGSDNETTSEESDEEEEEGDSEDEDSEEDGEDEEEVEEDEEDTDEEEED